MNGSSTGAVRLHCLLDQIVSNRFLPVPPPDLAFCGDGDFRAIGAEFLGHFVNFGDLQPHERALDIGCGPGRMAVPLTQYLSQDGSYTGVDIVASGITWCEQNITSRYPNFRFKHLDLQHPIYNPQGQIPTAAIHLPFPDASFDFISVVSVFTHLSTPDVLAYANEIARLLAPGGRCFATAFLLNPPARQALRTGASRLSFDPAPEGPEIYADSSAPLAAVAFDEDHFLEKFLRVGLHRRREAAYGFWSGRASSVYQDVCVFER